MARPYSQDLRERVVLCVASGATCREAAARFGVGVATAVRWSHRHRTTGDASARPMGGCRRAVLAGERDWLLARIVEKPDLTLRAIVAELAARDVRVSYDAVWRFYHQAGMTFKKKPARSRAGSTGRGPQTGTLATPSA